MDKLIEILLGVAQPPWNYVLLTVGGVLIIVPKVLSLRHEWFDTKIGRWQLQYEKEELEIIKLRYEIEALKKQYGLIDNLEKIPSERFVPPGKYRKPKQPIYHAEKYVEVEKIHKTHLPLWRQRIRALWLNLVLILLGLFMVGSIIDIVFIPILLMREGESILLAVGAGVTYAIFAYLSYLGFKKISRIKRGKNVTS